MRTDPRLPAGFVHRRAGRRTVYVRRDVEEPVASLGFLCGKTAAEPVMRVRGRAAHPVYNLPGTRTRVVWKRCRRGGLVEPLLGDLHRGAGRFLREVDLTEEARRLGVGVAEILALAVEDAAGGWKRVELLSRLVEDARDLASLLGDPTILPALRRSILRASAAELRRFHGSGLLHGDLNLGNLLCRLGEREVRVTLIDLDPGPERFRRLGATPQGNLLRLFRSYRKGARQGRWRLPATDLCSFIDEYFRGDRTAARAFWRAGSRRLRLAQLGAPLRRPNRRAHQQAEGEPGP
ncbi:MAG: lipopolysaccharide kinase InaA family protein [Planctomycetota bacterium]